MDSSLIILFTFCLCGTSTLTQFLNPLLLGSDFGENLVEGGGLYSYYLYGNLQNRIRQLELGVRSGAIGGCESGVLGPLSPAQPTGSIQFRARFLTPPALSLAVSDLTVSNIALPLTFQIRPAQITTTGAQVTLTDTTGTLASAFVSYMACPSGSSGSM